MFGIGVKQEKFTVVISFQALEVDLKKEKKKVYLGLVIKRGK